MVNGSALVGILSDITSREDFQAIDKIIFIVVSTELFI